MNITIDRDLPVPLGKQLRGQIEYGIACGDLLPGSQLPSVRDLARDTNLGTVTVAQVYGELRTAGLIDTQAGRGTFVAARPSSSTRDAHLERLRRQVDALIAAADRAGIPRGEVSSLVSSRLGRKARQRPLRILLIGLFPEATRAYASDLRAFLPAGDTVEATTIDVLRDRPAAVREARLADAVIVAANRRAEAVDLIGETPPVLVVNFIPSERTRLSMAEVDPRARVGLVSTFAEFLPTMRAGFRRFAPHVEAVTGAVLDDAEAAAELVRSSDVVVYATGSDRVLEGLDSQVRAFEYRHTPDGLSVERDILPVLGDLRERPDLMNAGGARPLEAK